LLYEGDEPGGERCAVRTAGSETGVQRCIPSVEGDKIVTVAVVQWETGTELGSSDPAVKSEKSGRGALIKLTNLGATSQFRNKKLRAGKKSRRQLLGTEVQVNGNKARALLDSGCEAELVLSTIFATSCGIHSHVDEYILVEFPDGTKLPSAAIENFKLCVAGVAHPVRAIVVELDSYEVILGKPWFTRHNPIVDSEAESAEHDGRWQVCGDRRVNGPALSRVPFHYQNLSDAVEKGGLTKGAGLLGSFEPDGSRPKSD
jgi:hypothetical protein